MKSLVAVFALLGGLAAAMAAQVPPPLTRGTGANAMTKVGLRTYVGAFAPALPLVATPANLTFASVELESGVAVGMELDYQLPVANLRAYLGITHARSRVNHSALMALQGPARPDSPVGLFVPTLGVIWSPTVGQRDVRPTVRVGGGVKFYDFDLVEVKNGVQDPTLDLGLGVSAGTQPVAFMAEVRWLVSRFNPTFVPVTVASATKQWQNDMVLGLGFRFGL